MTHLWMRSQVDREYFKTGMAIILLIINIFLNCGVPIVGVNRWFAPLSKRYIVPDIPAFKIRLAERVLVFIQHKYMWRPLRETKRQVTWSPSEDMISTYHETSNISRTLVVKLVDHWDVVGASPVGAAPTTLLWRHNGRGGVSNHQPHDCLLNRSFRRRSKKTSNLRVTGLCAGNSPVTGEFSAQMTSN